MVDQDSGIRVGEPLFIDVTRAASQLGISRGLAYSLCREYLAGRQGIPCRRFGVRRILVPRSMLFNLAESGNALLRYAEDS
jgi:hypothetical protein